MEFVINWGTGIGRIIFYDHFTYILSSRSAVQDLNLNFESYNKCEISEKCSGAKSTRQGEVKHLIKIGNKAVLKCIHVNFGIITAG